MPHSLKSKVKSLCYKGELSEKERDRLIHALEQKPCEDCISRTQALEMLGDEPENWTDTEKEIQEVNDYRWFKSILESLPSVTPKPCEDCISREAVIEWLKDKDFIKMKNQEENARRELTFLSSAIPKPCEEENPNCTECRYYDHKKHHCPRFCHVIEDTMAEITSEQGRWIPVSEKPQEGRYLCTYEHCDGKCIDFGSFDGEVWYIKPIAYMPIPQPYAESEE